MVDYAVSTAASLTSPNISNSSICLLTRSIFCLGIMVSWKSLKETSSPLCYLSFSRSSSLGTKGDSKIFCLSFSMFSSLKNGCLRISSTSLRAPNLVRRFRSSSLYTIMPEYSYLDYEILSFWRDRDAVPNFVRPANGRRFNIQKHFIATLIVKWRDTNDHFISII